MNPKYALLAQQGKVFQVSGATTGTTVAAGHVAPPAAGAATFLSILNPLSSSVNLEIIEATLSHISGTPGVGTFAYCHAYQGELVTAAQAVAIKRCLWTSAKTTVAQAWSATTLTGSVVHQVLAHFPSASFGGAIAATTEATGTGVVHKVDGMIIVPPGWMLTIAPAATGSSHVAAVSITYAEVASGNN